MFEFIKGQTIRRNYVCAIRLRDSKCCFGSAQRHTLVGILFVIIFFNMFYDCEEDILG